MDDEIKSDLDKECTRLINEVNKQKLSALELSEYLCVHSSDLVPFVAGMVYGDFEKYFKDLYVTKGMALENRVETDWYNYWGEKFPLLIDEIKKIYGD